MAGSAERKTPRTSRKEEQQMKIVRQVLTLGVALAGLTAGGAFQAPVDAQEAPIELDRVRVKQFARAHVGINAARDEFHGKVGRIHDEQGRERARQEMDVQVAEILTAQGMTREAYDDITLRISLDGEVRAVFDEVLLELAAERNDP
jgi:hypothetical protein